MQHTDQFGRILRAAVFSLGVWACYAQVSVLAGRSFTGLLHGTWIPVLLLAFYFMRSKEGKAVTADSVVADGVRSVASILILGLCSVAGMFFLRPGHPVAALIYVSGVIVTLVKIGDRLTTRICPQTAATKQSAIVLLVIVATVIVTLCEHRVNWDDAKYLHTVVAALEHPNDPLLVYDHLHGVNGLKILHPSMRLQTYELLVATISKISNIDHLFVYYLILPPLWGALAVLAHWMLIRRFSAQNAGIALIATFLVLAVWGSHRSYGAFAFDFVGRGIFVTFAVPALICATFEFVERPHFRSWLYLFFAAWTGCLLTSTAYAVAPVAVFLVLVACNGLSLNNIRAFALAILAIAWCPLLLFYVVKVAPLVTPLDVDTAGGAHFVFSQTQGKVAFVLFGLAPFLTLMARWPAARWLLRYVGICFLILLSGFLLEFVGHHSTILSWRLLWAIPVPIMIAVGIAASITYCLKFIPNPKLQRIAIIILLGLVVGVFLFVGTPAVFRNFGLPAVKMDKAVYPVVLSLAECSTTGDLMLAPPQIAVPLAGLKNAPSLVAVRGHHLSYLSGQWGAKESERRKRLFNIVQGEQNSIEDIQWMRNQLQSSSINRVILPKDNAKLDLVEEMLRSLNIDHFVLDKWEVWLPNTPNDRALQFRACVQRSFAD